MLKVDIGEGVINNIEFSGSGSELTTALCAIIHSIYKTMEKHNPMAAAGYRLAIQRIIRDPKFWEIAPVSANTIYADWPIDHRK